MGKLARCSWILPALPALVLAAACGDARPSPPATAPARDDGGGGPDLRPDLSPGEPSRDGPIGAADTSAPPESAADTAAPTPPVDAAGGSPDTDPGGPPAPGAFIPAPRGVCPEFAAGMITVRPGTVTRQVRLWISDAARTLDGPLVFYWYGTNGEPAEAERGLGSQTIAAITAAGGMVVAPVHDPAAGIWPWFLVAGTRDLDLQVADELVACAIEKVGIDRRRIHSVGFSAGAIQTVQLSYRRSGYIASVVTYSGAKAPGIPDQDPSNKLAAMIFHGGANDRVVVSFQAGSEMYKSDLAAAGRFALICNHGMGHRIPPDAAESAWRFLQDHPTGTTPSPYATTLPAGLPAYCMR
jgi:hypothetical protein